MALDFPNTPTAGATYTSGGSSWQWDGVKWVSIGVPGPAGALGGRNLLHNPYFNVQQRGAGPFTAANAFTADRWQVQQSLDTPSVSVISLTDAQRAQIGDEAATYGLQTVFTGNSGAASYTMILQKVEGIRRLSGKTVTLSFWAAGSTSLQIGLSFYLVYGSGGSPSASVQTTCQTISIGANMARYQATFNFPSAAGKTLGTNGDDRNALQMVFSSGSTNSAAYGVGVQAGTITLWGMQLEIGPSATPLEKIDPQIDLANCQRFYTAVNYLVGGYATAGSYAYGTLVYPVSMRSTPTLIFSAPANSNSSGINVLLSNSAMVQVDVQATATGLTSTQCLVLASADL